jgi:hypothetical protein
LQDKQHQQAAAMDLLVSLPQQLQQLMPPLEGQPVDMLLSLYIALGVLAVRLVSERLLLPPLNAALKARLQGSESNPSKIRKRVSANPALADLPICRRACQLSAPVLCKISNSQTVALQRATGSWQWWYIAFTHDRKAKPACIHACYVRICWHAWECHLASVQYLHLQLGLHIFGFNVPCSFCQLLYLLSPCCCTASSFRPTTASTTASLQRHPC